MTLQEFEANVSQSDGSALPFEESAQRAYAIVERALVTDDHALLSQLDALGDHVFLKGDNGRIFYFNESYRAFWNLKRASLGSVAEVYFDRSVSETARRTDSLLRLTVTLVDFRHRVRNLQGETYEFRTLKRSLASLNSPKAAIMGFSRPLGQLDQCDDQLAMQLAEQFSIYSAMRERDQEICRLTALGFSAREVAKSLHVSARAVELAKQKLYTKLGIAGSTQLTVMMVRFQERGMADFGI